MTSDEVLRIFRQTGALLDGHFVLRSGRHSRQFFQCALALQKMPVVEKLGAGLSGRVRDLGALVAATGADALDAETLAGALLDAAANTDKATGEG